MQTAKIGRDIEFEKKFLLCIYWTVRKSSTTEGCAPFYIKKIITPKHKYTQSSSKLLKLSPKLISDIQDDMGDFEHLEVEMGLGNEVLSANFTNEKFSISAAKNKDIEIEIVDKINQQSKMKYPRTCPQFSRRVYKH